MPDTDQLNIRIFCLCGQKMSVTASMLGKPGKCIACRQKIRIPRRDELPPDSSEIYLRDHPQFLRKKGVFGRPVESLPRQPPKVGNRKMPPSERLKAVPIDILEPLRLLANLEAKVAADLEAANPGAENTTDNATLLGYRALIHRLRSGLDLELRQAAAETDAQLTEIQEEIRRLGLNIRIGEINYRQYHAQVLPLRKRREQLALRRQNLRGWQAIEDVGMAGGTLDLSYEDIPCEASRLTFPFEPLDDKALVDQVVESLQTALAWRDTAEKQLNQWHRLNKRGLLEGPDVLQTRRDLESSLERARTAVGFCRRRLEHVIQDCEEDIKAIRSHLDQLRNQLSGEKLDRAEFQRQELELIRAQSDNTKTSELANRALAANSAGDVPQRAGTFLQRMGQPLQERPHGADSIIAWTAALLMLLNIVIPISDAGQGGNIVVMQGFALSLFVMAMLTAIVGAVAHRGARALLLIVLWTVGGVGGMAYLHETFYATDAVGAAMRADARWYLNPGVIVFFGSGIVLGAAACLAAFPFVKLRWLWLGAGLVVLAVNVGLWTDFGGLLRPKPAYAGMEILNAPETDGYYDTAVWLANAGLRTLYLDSYSARYPKPVLVLLERETGNSTWSDYGRPKEIRWGQEGAWMPLQGGYLPQLPPGQSIGLRYRLEPGEYRLRLAHGEDPTANLATEAFSLPRVLPPAISQPPPATDAASGNVPPAQPVTAGEPSAPTAPDEPLPQTVDAGISAVELRGVVGAGQQLKFTVVTSSWNGQSRQFSIELGEEVAPGWTAKEFNEQRNSLTIGNGDRMLILDRGEQVSLEE